MPVYDIREVIALAKKNEERTGLLFDRLHWKVNHIQRAVPIAAEQATAHLMTFVLAYIEHVPSMVDALGDAAEASACLRQVAPLINLVEDIFIYGSNRSSEERDLEELLSQAYLAHRLVEELNTHFVQAQGGVLASIDMASADLIAAHLIGEMIAPALAELARDTARSLFHEQGLKLHQIDDLWQRQWTHFATVHELLPPGLGAAH